MLASIISRHFPTLPTILVEIIYSQIYKNKNTIDKSIWRIHMHYSKKVPRDSLKWQNYSSTIKPNISNRVQNNIP